MLNTKQQIAFDGIIGQVLHNSTPKKSILTAKAGCGKTYLTAQIVLELLKAGVYITIVAPSHTARSVLMQAIIDNGLENIEGREKLVGMTVAAALGKRPDYSKKPKSANDTPFVTNPRAVKLIDNIVRGQPRLLIVEEVSMVGTHDVKSMFDLWGDNPVLVVGDFRQIPPVNAISARRFLGKYFNNGNLNVYKLDKNERTNNDTNISDYSNLIYESGGNLPSGDYAGVYTYTDGDKFETAFVDSVVLAEGQTTAIAYRNKTVSKYLNMADKGTDSVIFEPGDVVRLHEGITDNYNDPSNPDANKTGWVTETLAYNGDHINVLGFEHKIGTYTNAFIGETIEYSKIELDLVRHDGSNVVLLVPSDTDAMDPKGQYKTFFKALLKEVTTATEAIEKGKDEEKFSQHPQFNQLFQQYETSTPKDKDTIAWKKKALIFRRGFYNVREEFIRLTKLHALTSHKSQGQSITRVFVDMKDISYAKSTEQKQLKYVACSRAKEELHVLLPQ